MSMVFRYRWGHLGAHGQREGARASLSRSGLTLPHGATYNMGVKSFPSILAGTSEIIRDLRMPFHVHVKWRVVVQDTLTFRQTFYITLYYQREVPQRAEETDRSINTDTAASAPVKSGSRSQAPRRRRMLLKNRLKLRFRPLFLCLCRREVVK